MNHSHQDQDQDNNDAYWVSKSQKKRDSHAVQEIGEQLAALSIEQIKRIEMSESLREALLDYHRLTKHEAKRRQLQYVGKLMRNEETEPLLKALDVLAGNSREEVAKLHRLEHLRERLMADESVLTEIGNDFPGTDLSRLKQLRRNAIKEHAENKPPRAFREIFRILKELHQGNTEDGTEVNASEAEGDE